MRIVFIRLTAQKSKWAKTRRHCPLSAFWALSCGSTGLPLALECFANSASSSSPSLCLSLSLCVASSFCLFVCSLCNWFYSSQCCCCFAGHNARPNDTTRPVAAPTPVLAAAVLLRFCPALACAPCRCSCTSAARGIYLICWHRVAAAGTAVPLSWFRFYCLSLLSTWRAAPAPLPPLTLYLSLTVSLSPSLFQLLLSIVSSCRGCCAACDFITVDFWPSGFPLLRFFPPPLLLLSAVSSFCTRPVDVFCHIVVFLLLFFFDQKLICFHIKTFLRVLLLLPFVATFLVPLAPPPLLLVFFLLSFIALVCAAAVTHASAKEGEFINFGKSNGLWQGIQYLYIKPCDKYV